MEVVLNASDIVDLGEYVHQNTKTHNEPPGPAFLEYLITKFMRDKKGVDFFQEEREALEKEVARHDPHCRWHQGFHCNCKANRT